MITKVKKYRLYELEPNIVQQVCANIVEEEIYLLHKRYTPLSFEKLKLLKDKYLVIGLPNIQKKTKRCEVCFIRKQIQKKINKLHKNELHKF